MRFTTAVVLCTLYFPNSAAEALRCVPFPDMPKFYREGMLFSGVAESVVAIPSKGQIVTFRVERSWSKDVQEQMTVFNDIPSEAGVATLGVVVKRGERHLVFALPIAAVQHSVAGGSVRFSTGVCSIQSLDGVDVSTLRLGSERPVGKAP
jgi:hypothetical protein